MFLRPGAGLGKLLADQQNPSSADYHHWLTPEQFADRFGVSEADVGKVRAWLESVGLAVGDVARGRHWITFSGTAEKVGRALATEFHHLVAGGRLHYAITREPSVPAALAPVVAGFSGLDDFTPEPYAQVKPLYTAGSGSHYLAPGDIAAIYDLGPLYEAGFDGTGQRIAVVGQTAIQLADIEDFRNRFHLPAKEPEVVLFGSDPGLTGDQFEANLDIEWAGAVARNADIVYVYAQSADLAAQYAIDQNLAPVITMSYGGCEPAYTPASRAVAQQANAQGITWLVAAGDAGAAACDRDSPDGQASGGATTSFPATIPEVTAVGGTAFDEGEGTYWAKDNDGALASALGYVPEKAWNETGGGRLLAGGGGASALFGKPAWQTGPGVPDDNARDIPDVALAASTASGYIFVLNGGLYAAGGTSVAAPVFAGVVAMLNQYRGANGLGNINPALYRMAAGAPEAFHDITTGDNRVPCVQDSPGCDGGLLGFAAGAGYDLATGLGSIDAYRLFTNWGGGIDTSTAVTATPSALNPDDTVQLTASVQAADGSLPAGKVTFLAGGAAVGTAVLADGAAALTVPAFRLAAGDGTVTAVFGGDGTFNGSSAETSVTLNMPAPGNALVLATAGPNPSYAQASAIGLRCPVTVGVVEKAGVAAELTGFLVNGGDASGQIVELFGTGSIPANGSISGSLLLPVPDQSAETTFELSGVDAAGARWARTVSVTLTGPAAAAIR